MTDSPNEDEVSKRFGDNLFLHRTLRRISQETLAERAAIHRTQISLLESGQRIPLITTYAKLSGALELPYYSLLEGVSWEPDVRNGQGEFVVSSGKLIGIDGSPLRMDDSDDEDPK